MRRKGVFFWVVFAATVALFAYIVSRPAPTPEVPPVEFPEPIEVGHVIAGGEVGFSVPEGMGLALSEDQVLVRSYIPPCEQGFEYCLYYLGTTYAGTNFESAGVRIDRRADLPSEEDCMNARPEGRMGLAPVIRRTGTYSASFIGPTGDAAAGHYASGELYRLFVANGCYEFETRIGESQFMNYPDGSINLFTGENKAAVKGMLGSIIDNIVLISSNEKVIFP